MKNVKMWIRTPIARAKFAEIKQIYNHNGSILSLTLVEKCRDKEEEADEWGGIEDEKDESEDGIRVGEDGPRPLFELDADQDDDDEDGEGAGTDHVDEPTHPVHPAGEPHQFHQLL